MYIVWIYLIISKIKKSNFSVRQSQKKLLNNAEYKPHLFNSGSN